MNEPNVNQASPVLFKKRAVWEDISLEHFRFRAGELPEHLQQQHLIAISLSESCSGEIRTPSEFRAQWSEGQRVRDSFRPDSGGKARKRVGASGDLS
jgi:hypothetical protein